MIEIKDVDNWSVVCGNKSLYTIEYKDIPHIFKIKNNKWNKFVSLWLNEKLTREHINALIPEYEDKKKIIRFLRALLTSDIENKYKIAFTSYVMSQHFKDFDITIL
jgi:hypothetical protein